MVILMMWRWCTGDMWHVCLEGLKDVGSLCYGWRAEADVAWEGRSRFHPGTVPPRPPVHCQPAPSALFDKVLNIVPLDASLYGFGPSSTCQTSYLFMAHVCLTACYVSKDKS